MSTQKINTAYDPKPIPDRRFDWTAAHDDYEPGGLIGYGTTEQEAIDDLMQQLDDAMYEEVKPVNFSSDVERFNSD